MFTQRSKSKFHLPDSKSRGYTLCRPISRGQKPSLSLVRASEHAYGPEQRTLRGKRCLLPPEDMVPSRTSVFDSLPSDNSPTTHTTVAATFQSRFSSKKAPFALFKTSLALLNVLAEYLLRSRSGDLPATFEATRRETAHFACWHEVLLTFGGCGSYRSFSCFFCWSNLAVKELRWSLTNFRRKLWSFSAASAKSQMYGCLTR